MDFTLKCSLLWIPKKNFFSDPTLILPLISAPDPAPYIKHIKHAFLKLKGIVKRDLTSIKNSLK
jgi:hypothetical protein